MKKLKIHENKRYLMWESGEPFFYLADTGWNMFHKLSKSEIEYYLTVRAKQGFNVIQAVALGEKDGLAIPNAYNRTPLLKTNGAYDPTKPDEENGYDYWQHMDCAIDYAAEKGLFIALLPTWGDKINIKWGIGPEIFTPENAYVYGKWIAERYKDKWNIIWMLGGDRPLETDLHKKVIDQMAKGIKEVDQNHLVTYHPMGAQSSCQDVLGKDYIDFHTVQSGHAFGSFESFLLLRKTREAEEKPFMDSEPRYEDHPACFKAAYNYLWNAQDVRHNAYWNLMEGVCGHTYGNHSIWSFANERAAYFPFIWQEAIEHEGANQMKHLYKLRMSRSYFDFRHAPELVEQDDSLYSYQSAGRGDKYAYIYTPQGLPITANLQLLGESDQFVRASWFDTRTGEETIFKMLPCKKVKIAPPSYGEDYVLILEIME